ncbi:unnamed protein product [Rotaria sp. Silwood1]|nr:unnamed protein product [Rotaria sp. Silwood1]CAF1645682.1 unnamed protein product [Rotaria sp. Silwood1]CAF3834175.1 unnamed protein product [Rotaria sp. Silwood1]
MFSSTMTFFYISLDKVKSIGLNEEANVDTQIVSNTCLAHFEGFNNEMIYSFYAQTGSDRSVSFFLTATHPLFECHVDVLSNREHPSSPLCLIISPTCQHVLQTEDEARKITHRTAVVSYTELELDIRKLESLGLSSQEERVPWIFFTTFSNQLQQLAKHVLREDYICFYESANVDVAHTIEEVPFTKKQDLNVV